MIPPRSKYGNVPAYVGKRRYDSKLEARYAQQLTLEQKAGSVRWFIEQVPFLLEGGVRYRADFLVVRPDEAGSGFCTVEVVDCKGYLLPEARNKLKQVHARYGIAVLIYQRDGSLTPYTEVSTRRSAKQGARR